MTEPSLIRNFCIVAHIDHGKSTLADRLIEATGMLQKREMKAQVLDTLDLERERGITIKLNAVRMSYDAKNGQTYELNLIDTPGHVDFTYEVSRSLAACEGAILVVDASQGIQAQTLSNLFLAMEAGLEIIPILNKIDLPGAEPEKRRAEVVDLLGCKPEDILLVSAKEGLGIPELLEEVVAKVPSPRGDAEKPLRALIYDSFYDRYRGAIPSVRVVDGVLKKGTKITFGASDAVYEVEEVGYNQLRRVVTPQLTAGEVGFVVANVRSVKETRAGDTIFDAENKAPEPLPGYQAVRSFVFAGVYPTDTQQYEDLRDALEKLQLNDASLQYQPESSTALGFGFRCGFLGLLHMEIVQERLEREFDLDLVTTVPSVEYHVFKTDNTEVLDDLWTADFKGQFRTQDQIYCSPLTIADQHTRFLLSCHGLSSVKGEEARPVFERTFREYGLPRAIRTDNGPPFVTRALCGLSHLNVWWMRLGIQHQRIRPASPQENGAHERMHRTLKREAIRPPRASMRAQQRAFDAFRAEYNAERPHAHHGGQPPGSQYEASPREYPSRLPALEYPGHYVVKRVTTVGTFRFKTTLLFIANALRGYCIGLDEEADGIWSIYFGDILLAKLDERDMIIRE